MSSKCLWEGTSGFRLTLLRWAQRRRSVLPCWYPPHVLGRHVARLAEANCELAVLQAVHVKPAVRGRDHSPSGVGSVENLHQHVRKRTVQTENHPRQNPRGAKETLACNRPYGDKSNAIFERRSNGYFAGRTYADQTGTSDSRDRWVARAPFS